MDDAFGSSEIVLSTFSSVDAMNDALKGDFKFSQSWLRIDVEQEFVILVGT